MFTTLVSQLPLDDMLKTLTSLDIYSAQCSEPDNRKGPFTVSGTARTFADLPGGHSEGYGDIFKQIFRTFYASILDPDLAPEYPQMEDGLHQMKLLDAALASNAKRNWVELSTE